MKLVFIFLWICLVTGFVAGCEEEIKGKIKSFVKGKDWKVLFKKYAQRCPFLEIFVIRELLGRYLGQKYAKKHLTSLVNAP